MIYLGTTQNISISNLFVVPIVMAVFSLAAIFSEFGNGACFALVPHRNLLYNVSNFI